MKYYKIALTLGDDILTTEFVRSDYIIDNLDQELEEGSDYRVVNIRAVDYEALNNHFKKLNLSTETDTLTLEQFFACAKYCVHNRNNSRRSLREELPNVN